MKRKRNTETTCTKPIYVDNMLKVYKESKTWFFEINREITNDLGEAVSIMIMNTNSIDDNIWNIDVNDENRKLITPEKALYWLSGGDKEWLSNNNYSKPWSECYIDFQKEYGDLIVDIIESSETLGDIRDEFIDKLNISILYDYAISKDMI